MFERLRRRFFIRLRRSPVLFKVVVGARDHLPMVLSLALHAFVVILLTVDFVAESKDRVVSVPMFVVDLSKVKIAEMTNLPPKLTLSKSKAKSAPKGTVRTSAYSKASKGDASQSSFVASKSSLNGAMLENELSGLLKKVSKSKKSKDEELSNSIKNIAKSADKDAFKTLLASVDGIKSGMGYADESTADADPDDMVTRGIEGGQGGSYMQELSVSEKDMIGIKLRECWNLDAGVRGAQNMLIEIRVFLTPEGAVKDVKILNKARYNKDTAFRSVAESARRAVYICDKKNDASPFRIFPDHYGQSYDMWKTLLLRFNPFDGGVM